MRPFGPEIVAIFNRPARTTAVASSHLLDGFGAGTSAIASLQRLPFTGVKLDATLAPVCAGAGAESRWVPALVELAHAMRLEVHAVGADTEPQCAALMAAGCDGVQGRRLGQWMEDQALESWLGRPASDAYASCIWSSPPRLGATSSSRSRSSPRASPVGAGAGAGAAGEGGDGGVADGLMGFLDAAVSCRWTF